MSKKKRRKKKNYQHLQGLSSVTAPVQPKQVDTKGLPVVQPKIQDDDDRLFMFVKSDLVRIGILVAAFVALFLVLFYLNKNTDILADISQKLFNSLGISF